MTKGKRRPKKGLKFLVLILLILWGLYLLLFDRFSINDFKVMDKYFTNTCFIMGITNAGKSTFIKRFIENLVVPNITDEYEKKHCLDEIPQSAQGKTIMTTEPKFVPSNGADDKVGAFKTNIKLVDCVGFVIPGSKELTLQTKEF